MRHLYFLYALAALMVTANGLPVLPVSDSHVQGQEVIAISEPSNAGQSSPVDNDMDDDQNDWDAEGGIGATVLRLIELVESLPIAEDGTQEYKNLARLIELVDVIQEGSCNSRVLDEIQNVSDALGHAGERFSAAKKIKGAADELCQQREELEGLLLYLIRKRKSTKSNEVNANDNSERSSDGDFVVIDDELTDLVASRSDNEGDAEDEMDWITMV